MTFLRYCMAGAAALGLNLAILSALLSVVLPWIASATGFVIACLFNYTAQRWWVFRSSRSIAASAGTYAVVTTILLGVNTTAFTLLLQVGFPAWAAQTLATCVVFLGNYHANRRFTFTGSASFG